MISKFQDLIAWQKARELTREIYTVTRRGSFARDFALVQQIRRAAISVMSNIAEGFERSGQNEFHQFLVVAKGSAGEIYSQLYIALDAGHLSSAEFNQLQAQTQEVCRVLGGLRASVDRSRGKKAAN